MMLVSLHLYAAPQTTIYFWHSMGGSINQTVETIVNRFNHSQSKYKVIPVYKGNYTETLTSTVAAFRAHQQPTIVQIFEVATATMTEPKGVIVPVYQLMQHYHLHLNTDDFLPAIRSYYSDKQGRLLALPFNSSAAVLYYNKDAFKKAGLNPTQPPSTWSELVIDAKRLLRAGYSCGFSTTWPSWTQIETFSSWQNLPIATDNNGFESIHAKMIFNNPTVIHQIQSLAQWQKQNIFRYGGREDNAMALFTSGQCQMLIQSSGARASLKHSVDFNLGTAMLPYWPDATGAPQNAIIGGAALWALSGKSQAQYRAASNFFEFLSKPNIQAYWQQQTGYIPITHAAFTLSQKQGYYQKNPGALVAIKELDNKPPKPYTRGLRLGNYARIRNINCEEIETAIMGISSAKQAMNHAVQRDNLLLKQFAETTQ